MVLPNPVTDAELVEAISSKLHVNGALLYLYKRHYHGLERYVLTNQGTQADAEDLVQEVMVSLVDLIQRGKYRGEASIKSLLYTLARNHWVSVLRKRGSDVRREEWFETERGQIEEDVSNHLLDLEAQQTLTGVFNRLGEVCQKILRLFYYEDLSMREILLQTDFGSEQALRNKKSKCLKDLTEFVRSKPELFTTLRDALRRTL